MVVLFSVLSVVAAVGILYWLFWAGAARDPLLTTALGCVMAGVLGNLYDRLRWDRGVVDFIGPIDLGVMLWPIFNVADMAISCGAVLLAISFWREERRDGSTAVSAGDSSSHPEDPAAPAEDSVTRAV